MARNTSKPDTILQEWTPMSDLLNKIPSKTQIGIFNHDVNLTCVDVLPEFIALGSNSGIVYWYDRKKNDMQRLRCEVCISFNVCLFFFCLFIYLYFSEP